MDRQDSERRERKDVQRNLERVLQAAQTLFALRGMAVTMEEVARQAGLGVGTVYRRFPSKEHLFAAVSHAACRDMHHCLQQAVAAERDPVHRLAAVVHMHYHRNEQQAALLDLRARLGQDGRNYSPSPEQQQLAEALHHLLQHIIVDGQQQGVFRRGDPRTLAAFCAELLKPQSFESLRRTIGGRTEDLADQVVHFLLQGLQATEPA
ncbi:MAG: TetR/AcrR family transcriptional regulator [Herpetosiphonaceae bacterium]|nr:TetR/AcrR family transcriptional regulator [Herpetosiphonaceae bacterium]